MIRDFLLASAHHLLAFGLVAMIVTQSVLLSRDIDAATLRRLAGVDRGLGIVATLLLVVGWVRANLCHSSLWALRHASGKQRTQREVEGSATSLYSPPAPEWRNR